MAAPVGGDDFGEAAGAAGDQAGQRGAAGAELDAAQRPPGGGPARSRLGARLQDVGCSAAGAGSGLEILEHQARIWGVSNSASNEGTGRPP